MYIPIRISFKVFIFLVQNLENTRPAEAENTKTPVAENTTPAEAENTTPPEAEHATPAEEPSSQKENEV